MPWRIRDGPRFSSDPGLDSAAGGSRLAPSLVGSGGRPLEEAYAPTTEGVEVTGTHAHVTQPLFGMSALADQDSAGLVMMAEQMLLLGAAAAVLLRRHLIESDEAAALEPARSHPFAA